MSHEENNYTELESYTKPMDMYTVPATGPERDLRENSNTIPSSAKQQSKYSSCFIKLIVVATLVNFFLVIAIGAAFAYVSLTTTQADRASDSSLLQGSGAETGAPGVQGPPGPPGEAGADGIPGPQGPPAPGGGVAYTHWGRTTCPNTPGTELVYEGIIAGSRWDEAGSSNYLCLHTQPQPLQVTSGPQDDGRAYLYATLYDARGTPPDFGDMRHHDAPCAVCYSSGRTATITIPGRTSCPPSWTREYYGYMMAEHSQHPRSGRAPVCVDVNAESIPGSNAGFRSTSALYFMETRCVGLCPPYEDGDEISCAVCAK